VSVGYESINPDGVPKKRAFAPSLYAIQPLICRSTVFSFKGSYLIEDIQVIICPQDDADEGVAVGPSDMHEIMGLTRSLSPVRSHRLYTPLTRTLIWARWF